MSSKQLWIVDFGSQYTQLITRICRDCGVSSEILTVDKALKLFQEKARPKALVLSGGPQSVFEDQTDYQLFFNDPALPVLGICYGMQLMGQFFKGQVVKGHLGEYGEAQVEFVKSAWPKIDSRFNVWMSHSDHLEKVPPDFEVVMKSSNQLVAAMEHKSRPLLGLQFHPEVDHGQFGQEIIEHFLFSIAQLEKDWDAQMMLQEALETLKGLDKAQVLCAFSGGVDSLVAATVAAKVLGDRLHCFFVDHGLLRPQDLGHIKILQEQTGLHIHIVNAQEIFLKKLEGLSDPEAKRKMIGRTFIEVFDQKVKEFAANHGVHFTHLLQGTLYPDVIESTSPHESGGKSVTIKSHHNVGGLPEKMQLKLVEPLRYLFKDEVRCLGVELGLNQGWVARHPFPGPGIGIRVLGALNPKSISQVGQSDQILFEELHKHQLYDKVWQAFTVLLPVYTVGVKGDGRAYEQVIALRLVNSADGMTAVWSDLPREFLSKVSARITNEVRGITRVVYDITSKPPGTIEWE